MTSLRVLEESS